MEQEVRGNMAPPQETTPGIVLAFNLSPMLFHLTMKKTAHDTQQAPHPMQPAV